MLKPTLVTFLVSVIVLTALWSCSTHQPAPVTTAGFYSQSNKGRLQDSHYTVTPGDTLYSIAWLANLDPNELAAINHIPAPYLIYSGQELSLLANTPEARTQRLPDQSEKTAKSPTTIQYLDKEPEKQTLQSGNKEQINSKKASKSVSKVAENGRSSIKSVKKPNKKLEQKNNKAYSENPKQEEADNKNPDSNVVIWQMPSSGEIISRFSSAENGNKGIDIIGKRGQAVYAAASGKVVYAGSALSGYGKLIIVKHNDDYLSAYAHNNKFHVQEQDIVNAGQRIADMGDSDALHDMLHFEIRYRGKSVDPERYLPK